MDFDISIRNTITTCTIFFCFRWYYRILFYKKNGPYRFRICWYTFLFRSMFVYMIYMYILFYTYICIHICTSTYSMCNIVTSKYIQIYIQKYMHFTNIKTQIYLDTYTSEVHFWLFHVWCCTWQYSDANGVSTAHNALKKEWHAYIYI